MSKYFTIERLKEAIEHLQDYDSNWIIVPLVFAVNGVNTQQEINIRQKVGGDIFLNEYFHGNLIGLPEFENKTSALRPRFSDIYGNMRSRNLGNDYVLHQNTKLWANIYSSRGYREMRTGGLVLGENSKFQLHSNFWDSWSQKLPQTFHFEELLIWLYAFNGVPDEISSWQELFKHFQEKHLGYNKTFEKGYLEHFNVDNGVSWPDEFLQNRLDNQQYQEELLPSYQHTTDNNEINLTSEITGSEELDTPIDSLQTKDINEIVAEFSQALKNSGVDFGRRHDEVVRTFIISLITKPFVILTGLSGSGKTQIATKFGEWLGANRWVLIPVRPDWTGGEVLFGYEDALDQNTSRSWFVPPVLEFMLRASEDLEKPYLLILDEMNLAHVERYFGDFLAGIESRSPVLPNLVKGEDGKWRLKASAENRIPIPRNLFVVGTVNVDETTYMFSPKVLDRANTIEFRVETDELTENIRKPNPCPAGDLASVKTFLKLSTNDEWQQQNPLNRLSDFAGYIKSLHRILSESGFEFGHRVFYEILRYAAFYQAAVDLEVNDHWKDSLDFQVLQKILPRLHGSQKRLGLTLRLVSKFCYFLEVSNEDMLTFDPDSVVEDNAQLKRSFKKLKRMYRNLKAYQFTSFTE